MNIIMRCFGKYHIVISLIIVLICAGCDTRPDREMVASKTQDILKGLETTSAVFVADGAHDYHVNIEFDILSLQTSQELMQFLTDDTPTKTIYRDDEKVEHIVPLGYLVLDVLLLQSASDSMVFLEQLLGDAPWYSVRPDFFFPPDILNFSDGRKRMREVQQRWIENLKTGKLTFKSQPEAN